VPTGPVTLIDTDPLGRSNTFTFQPDPTIFETLACEYAALAACLEDWAYWTPGLHITLRDERMGQEQARVFYAPAGLRDWIVALNRDHTVLHSPFHIQAEVGQTAIEVALQYTQENTPVSANPSSNHFADWGRTPRIWSFVNHHPTYFGGTHVTGLLTAITRTVNAEARSLGLLSPTAPALTGRDIRQGLTAIINVRLRDAKSNNSMGYNLTSPEVRGQVQELVTRTFARFLAEHPAAAAAILSKIQETVAERTARRLLHERRIL
jgi:DNA gyrase subunit B